MDQKYWDEFYRNGESECKPSLFAQFVETKLEERSSLADLGCGNGRDSFYFAKRGHKVFSIDLSGQAIAIIQKKQCESIFACCDNFVSFLETHEAAFDALYSRFSIHAISCAEQKRLLKNAYKSLKKNGLFFIEVRSVQDELYGKGTELDRDTFFYNGHARRFIRAEELLESLRREQFEIVYSKEQRGFAPFGKDNPIVVRIVARRMESEKIL